MTANTLSDRAAVDAATLAARALDADTPLARDALADMVRGDLADTAYENAHAYATWRAKVDSTLTGEVSVWDALVGAHQALCAVVNGTDPLLRNLTLIDPPTEDTREVFVVTGRRGTVGFPDLGSAREYLNSDADGGAYQVYRWDLSDGLPTMDEDEPARTWEDVENVAALAPDEALTTLYDDTFKPRPQQRTLRLDTSSVLEHFNGRKAPCLYDTATARMVPVTGQGLAEFLHSELLYAYEDAASTAPSEGERVSVGYVLTRLLGILEEYMGGERELEPCDLLSGPRKGDDCYLIVRNRGEVSATVVRTEREAREQITRGGVRAVLPGIVCEAAASWEQATGTGTGKDPVYVNHLD